MTTNSTTQPAAPANPPVEGSIVDYAAYERNAALNSPEFVHGYIPQPDRKGIPYPATLEARAAYGPLYRRWVAARRSGCNEHAEFLASEYRRLNEPAQNALCPDCGWPVSWHDDGMCVDAGQGGEQ